MAAIHIVNDLSVVFCNNLANMNEGSQQWFQIVRHVKKVRLQFAEDENCHRNSSLATTTSFFIISGVSIMWTA